MSPIGDISLEGIVRHFPRRELGGWALWPKRHREEALDGYPKGAKALKTLDDENVLNRANFAANTNMDEAHYKNEDVEDMVVIAKKTAKYMLHSNIEDRRRWCEKLVTGNTSICSVVRVIEAYRQAHATLTHQNTMDARKGDRVLVIDSSGVIH